MKFEVELQYLYRGEAPLVVPVELASMTLATSERFDIVDSYFDTEQLDLRREGCSLRVRQTGNEPLPQLTFKGRSSERGSHNGKARREIELPVESIPQDTGELTDLLREVELLDVVAKAARLADDAVLCHIGVIRNDRSTHRYVNGMHELELTWDRLEYPVGPKETRLELEVKWEHAESALAHADAELRQLLGDDLVEPKRGKVRELCERLYPQLVAA
jgi:inorganic triphosphatase YgiF